ncbi:NUDIX domain-containing protein [Wohlfahrtiimonas chitiniclastica]|uniref:NUDIX hydrolase n=1 Tax=Wohlfahrtiimonas chitiniclastica TaxID=400946 RepID=UPI0007B412C2|nr:NUDIX domain-containing protein [Wohlfahrtiimonas chitiniclastica]MBS7817940.1 NUDIX domain-containing protein [Wohlfahrtiimonas chitiniclastica]MBS7819751.1 NUDIX domain-containing protein [Wohlfahrtiimonas chitiniclastica]MBS7825907.1 NUDIX domain-containing protein [Wohlfahrtiimonas chitiniclastica]MBS7835370.1 NUDIX domain-containing protein [Wohlfahrtiimonas chitiniclastica]MDC7251524.1 DNA mismatch repair protein MutT [Wohlfahrtiimonas chitiniclastica]
MTDRKPNYFYIAAAMVIDHKDRLLLVRKRNTEKFMLPGGKIDGTESPLEALMRELQEEIDLTITPDDAHFLQTYDAKAANEPDHRIESNLFRITLPEGITITPQAEIEEIVWLNATDYPTLNFAPLVVERILPLWQEHIRGKQV